MWKKLTLDHSGHCKTLHKQRLTFDEDWFSPEDPPNRALQWYSFSTWWNGVIYNFYIWKSVCRVSTDLTKAITVIWFLKSVNSLMEFHMTYLKVGAQCEHWNSLSPVWTLLFSLLCRTISYSARIYGACGAIKHSVWRMLPCSFLAQDPCSYDFWLEVCLC